MTRRETFTVTAAAAVLLLAAGFGAWQAARVRGTRDELAAVRTQLALQRHESTLALAAIEATRGSYELGRQLASSFFTGLQATVSAAPAEAREPLSQILAQRDAMITALSRSDPQAAPQLTQLLIRYRMALGEPVGPPQPAAGAPARPPAHRGAR